MSELFQPAPAETIQPGAKLYWLYTAPGGYNLMSYVKCVVLRRLPSGRVKIQVWKRVGGEWGTTERSVEPAKLRSRIDGRPVWEHL